jgi:hypothetical protein
MQTHYLQFLTKAVLPTLAALCLLATQTAFVQATSHPLAPVGDTEHHTVAATEDAATPEKPYDAIAPYTLPEVNTIYFAETQHHLSNRSGFLDFWRSNGQRYIFGFPITEEFVEHGRVVQYFEKVRFEHHPEMAGTQWEVQVGLLGRDVQQTGAGWDAIPDPQSGVLYFPETQHTLQGEFLNYWQRRGGVQIFGYPISEQMVEGTRTVQYFERAKLEYHPEDMAPFYRAFEYYGRNLNTLHEVVVSDLGKVVAEQRQVNTKPIKQLQGAPTWTPALWARHIDVDLSTQWLTAYEDNLIVYRAPVTTGRPGFYTPVGNFAVYDKLPMQTMRGSMGGETWNVPNIPWVMYVNGSVAMHGTYWHDLFGSGALMSHGCINLAMDDAQWIYEWNDIGTTVRVHY